MIKSAVFVIMVSLFSSLSVAADNYTSRDDALALVSRVVKAINTDKETTLREITAKDKKWIDRDLYPVVYDNSGKCLAHGQNEKSVGKDLIDMEDADGKAFVKERVELAKTHVKFSQEYKFKDPASKKVLPKTAFCEKSDTVIVCAGIYKH